MIGDVMRSLRDLMLVAERLNDTTALAKQADQRSIELGERLARVEAVLDYALHGTAPSARRRPDSLQGPN